MRRIRSGCCPRAATGHAAAAPPSAASNSRRPMVTVIRPSRVRCVNGTIPRHQRTVFTSKEGRIGREWRGPFHTRLNWRLSRSAASDVGSTGTQRFALWATGKTPVRRLERA